MKNHYDLCVYYKRWRFYPADFPWGTVHVHGGPRDNEVTTWEEAHMVWGDTIQTKGLLQAVLFRDDVPIRIFHHLKGEGEVTLAEPS